MRLPLLSAPLWLVVACHIENGLGGDYPPDPVSNPPPVEDTVQVDRIVQVTTPMVDILWTIDNSSSMFDEQQELTSNFPSFMDYFLNSGLDYHIGVTSTDIDGNYNGSKGKLRNAAGVTYIDPDTSNPLDVFAQMAGMGTNGSGDEKGLGGTFEALETNRDTANAGFYRDDAAIHTIIISDEPDITQASIVTQPEFVEWYDGLKSDDDDRSFSSIIDLHWGTKYKISTVALGGIVWDITSDDWPQLLERLGVQASGLKREYYLSQLPVDGTLEVTVEDVTGAELAFVEATFDAYGVPVSGDYTYDGGRNSITFLTYIPNPLATVVMTYTLLASQHEVNEIAD